MSNIPPEALEAAAVVLMGRLMMSREDAARLWAGLYEPEKEQFRREARAAFLAIVEAWPNSEVVPWYHADETLILPLNTENTDAEA